MKNGGSLRFSTGTMLFLTTNSVALLWFRFIDSVNLGDIFEFEDAFNVALGDIQLELSNLLMKETLEMESRQREATRELEEQLNKIQISLRTQLQQM